MYDCSTYLVHSFIEKAAVFGATGLTARGLPEQGRPDKETLITIRQMQQVSAELDSISQDSSSPVV